MSADEERCEAVVWKRDTYRYSGRGKNGFTMHYSRCRCTRRAKRDGLCGQHAAIAERGVNVLRYESLWR